MKPVNELAWDKYKQKHRTMNNNNYKSLTLLNIQTVFHLISN